MYEPDYTHVRNCVRRLNHEQGAWSAAITIGGMEYELVLTTRATKEIAGRYGGLENLGDKLMKSENFEMALDEIIWLITLLANQSVLIHNLQHPEGQKGAADPGCRGAADLSLRAGGVQGSHHGSHVQGHQAEYRKRDGLKNAEVG